MALMMELMSRHSMLPKHTPLTSYRTKVNVVTRKVQPSNAGAQRDRDGVRVEPGQVFAALSPYRRGLGALSGRNRVGGSN